MTRGSSFRLSCSLLLSLSLSLSFLAPYRTIEALRISGKDRKGLIGTEFSPRVALDVLLQM